MKRLLIVSLFAVAFLAACTTPTPTTSPPPTPTPNTSPIATPEAENRVEDDTRIEKPKSEQPMEETKNMNAETLAGLVGIGLSLGFSYIPGLEGWYGRVGREQGATDEENDKRNAQYKRMIMGILVVVFGAGVFGLSCAGIVDAGITCDQAGAVGLFGLVCDVLIMNQGAYSLTKRTK